MDRTLDEVVARLPVEEQDRARYFLQPMPKPDLSEFDSMPLEDRLWVLGAWQAREEIEAHGGVTRPIICPKCGEFEAKLAAGSCDLSYGWWRRLFGFAPKTTTSCPKCGSKSAVKIDLEELTRRELPDLW